MSKDEATTIVVAAESATKTLAAFLRQHFPDRSWNEVRRWIAERRVMVSGNLCLDPARRLQANEVVKAYRRPLPPPPREADVFIEFIDSQVVVVRKPAGMTTVRHHEELKLPLHRRQLQPTLDEVLPSAIARYEKKPPKKRPHAKLLAVHRLDRETSGLILFARTTDAQRHLGHQFRKHTIHRRYLAIAFGRVQAQTLESRLVRDRGDGRRGSTRLPHLGQHAITHVRPLEYLRDHTLVECRLETGRTHQIRIHLCEAGHPVAGDRVYRKAAGGPIIADDSGTSRVALHAAELGFVHPTTNETLRFAAPFPDDLASLLARLRTDGGANPIKQSELA